MKLQILVPQYNETENTIKNLLDSIEIQQKVDLQNDIGVIIVNDGSNIHLSREFLDGYSYKIDYYLNEHKGVSATRNSCLQNSTADYIMFCDADDMFYNVYALYTIFEKIEKGFDILIPPFIEEFKEKDIVGRSYIIHENDTTFVHGKVYRKQYLIENDIVWNTELTLHEDGYFNTLAKIFAKSVEICEEPFYLWKWRDDSVCRKENNWVMNTHDYFISSKKALIRELISRDKLNIAQHEVFSVIFKTYLMMNTSQWEKCVSEEYKIVVKNLIKDFYLEFKTIFNSISNIDKFALGNNERIKFCKAIKGMSLNKWLEWIQN
jgi:glycosyltransferase involved in cell wall biosynthesis